MPIRSSSQARAQLCGSGRGGNVAPGGNKDLSNFEPMLRRSLRARRNTFARFAHAREKFRRRVALLPVLPRPVLEVAPVSRSGVVVDLQTRPASVRVASGLRARVNK